MTKVRIFNKDKVITWLLAHQHLWEGIYCDPLSNNEIDRRYELAKQMKAEGLYSKTTYSRDIVSGQSRLLRLAREVRRSRS
jgi:hypothetical protein